MAKRCVLDLLQRNDEDVQLAITEADTGDPQNLTGVIVEAYFKTSAEIDDDTATVLSTASGEIVVQAPATAGIALMAVPQALVTNAGGSWWRTDVVAAGKRKTAMYGPFIVRDT
jgi:hypothetical protein